MFKTTCLAGVMTLCFSLTSIARADLIGYWPLDEGAGITTADASGFGNDGTFLGDPQWVPGVFGMALEFDGDDVVVIPNEAQFDFASGSYSFACWIKPDPSTRNWGCWFSKGWGDTNQGGFVLNRNAGDNVVCFGGGYPAPNGDLPGTVDVFDGQWHHIVCVYDADAQTKVIYDDGTLTVGPVPYTTALITNDRPLNIGGADRSPAARSSEAIGPIDDCGIWNHALSAEEVEDIFNNGVINVALARIPNPANGATDVAQDDVVLSWVPGDYAEKHDMYLGTNFDDVDDATTTVDPSGLYMGRQNLNAYATARLELGQTYYWRIDEVEADGTIHTGNVWSFTTELPAYPVENITATASSSNSAEEGPENTVNGSGLDGDDLHSMDFNGMWFSGSEPLGAWIQYEFDKVYKLHQMWVWNYNTPSEPLVGFGFKDVTIEYSADGTDWMELVGVSEFTQAPGAAGYAHNTTVDFGDAAAKYVKITANSNWTGIFKQYGLSEVRFLYIPVRAREPDPDSGTTDVAVDVTLGFRAGREAAKHDVYLSTDEQAVIDGTAPVTTVTGNSYSTSLDLDSTYYWRVDEVNDAETPTTWQGDIWNFTTHEYFVVDDFESYNDLNTDEPGSNRIFSMWIDGLGYGEAPPAPGPYSPGNGTGAIVGYADPPFAEQSNVHSDAQSMPLGYDNSSPPFYSETEHTFATFQDWTKAGVETLRLYFKGIPPAFTQSPEGVFTISAGGADIWGTSDEGRFLYKQLSGDGSIVCQVRSVENTHEWARVGPMIRQTLEAGSAHSYIMLSAAGHVEFAYRRTTDAGTDGVYREGFPAPHWVRLTRTGDTFTGEHSEDGVNWVPVGDDPEASSVTIGMGQNVFIGFAYTGHAGDVMGVAEFSDVTTTGSVTGTWQAADLGIEMGSGNDAEPLYVAVEDSSARVKVVSNDDPLAAQAHNWQEWNIDLKEFSNAGVNLSSVKKIYISVGNKATPQTGGKGTLYIDDIRLYPPARVQPENMITNGDFEQPDMGPEYWGDGQPDGWFVASGSDSPYLANEKAAFLEEPWSNGTEQYAEFNGSGVYYQDVGVNYVAGQSYILSAKIGLENFSSVTPQTDWFVELRDADTDTVWARIDQDDLGWPDYGHWLDAVVEYTVPAADGPAGKEVRVAIGLGATGWAVDKVKLLESDAGE